ncbi:Protein AIR2 [Madurella mycetomatis]|uniref:Protein AIR2 n=1 Tax=Madurella mycetomatis TaxID=100816 RepID=A0A175W256_9PEZI|nr:Protein AIR2 [Madurella mycetomatis]
MDSSLASPDHTWASSQPFPSKKRPSPDTDAHGDLKESNSWAESAEDTTISPRKRAKVDSSPTADAARDPGDGETASSKPSSGCEPPQANQSAVDAPSRVHGGWNRGISNGLRTSFAATIKDRLPKPSLQRASESPAQQDVDSSRNALTRGVDDLVMPQGDLGFSKRPSHGSTWQSRFVDWAGQLMRLNKDREGIQDAALLRDAWNVWLQTRVTIQPIAREAALQAAAGTDLDCEKLGEMFATALASELDVSLPISPAEAGHAQSGHNSDEQTCNGAKSASEKAATQAVQEPNTWAVPSPPSPSWHFEVRQKDKSAWEGKFVAWCQTLARLNKDKIRVDTPRDRNRLTESYLRWIGTVDGLSKAKAAAARRAATHYTQENSMQLSEALADSRPLSEHQVVGTVTLAEEDTARPATAATSSTSSGLNDAKLTSLHDGEDAEYREKYFPGIGPDETFCVMCASRGHVSTGCPAMICRFCHDAGHPSFSCPARRRCTKCRQLGHTKEDCREKLALAPEEMDCAFCQSRDHLDASCPDLRRSFLSDLGTVRKVRSLPIFCYCCGCQGHYGPACGLNPHKPKESQWEAWSQANCARYIDPSSPEVAIVFSASLVTAPEAGPAYGRPDLGKSIVPRRHIVFEEADDDDEAEDFIRPPVQRNARPGQITFSGNNSMANRGGRRSSKQYGAGNGRATSKRIGGMAVDVQGVVDEVISESPV